MNSEWRKAIHKKHQLYNRYWKIKSQTNWYNYKQQRNLCEKLKRSSMRTYMQEKCEKAKHQPRDFWKMVSPYLSNKSNSSESIQLIDNDKYVTNAAEVAELFNDRFTKVADSIGNDSQFRDDLTDHPSFKLIDERMKNVNEFNFVPTNVAAVEKIIDKTNGNKASGYDSIPPKAWKLSSDIMSPHICNVANKMFELSTFPDSQKKAEVLPIHKSKSRLEWSNYRPVSILTSLSKILEQCIARQIQPHLECTFSKFLSAYRANHGCHSVLEYTTEIWKRALDEKLYVGVLMSDLSKAFDCLPYNLLVEKLRHYKFSDKATNLLSSYLCKRFQRVKISQNCSDWKELSKGVPQGSIIGP
jgi:hypothetical protein